MRGVKLYVKVSCGVMNIVLGTASRWELSLIMLCSCSDDSYKESDQVEDIAVVHIFNKFSSDNSMWRKVASFTDYNFSKPTLQ